MLLDKTLNESDNEKQKNFQLLRPTFGHPTKTNDLEKIDNQEKQRQDNIQNVIDQLRSNTIVNRYL